MTPCKQESSVSFEDKVSICVWPTFFSRSRGNEAAHDAAQRESGQGISALVKLELPVVEELIIVGAF